MTKSELEGILETFAPGSGFGNPDDRRAAELRLQAELAEQQRKSR